MDKISGEAIFGHAELKQFDVVVGDSTVYFGYSLHYDGAGRITKVTRPSELSRVTWDKPKPQQPDLWLRGMWAGFVSGLIIGWLAHG